MIITQNLTKSYNDKIAVNDFSACIQPGSITALIGPNGAGKSTTISMLTGSLKPDSGKVKIDGLDISGRNTGWKYSIGIVTERLNLFNHLTVYEHMLLTAEIFGISKNETLSRTAELLKFFNLENYQTTTAQNCSLGVRKKTALSMALIYNPKIIFLDEALTGLDPLSLTRTKLLLKKLADIGHTVFLTTHILDIVEKLADRIITIDDGKIINDSTCSSLLKQYGNLDNFFISFAERDEEAGKLSWLL